MAEINNFSLPTNFTGDVTFYKNVNFAGGVVGVPEAVEAIPSGTSMLFYQASAPTGWTKQTTHNDKSLRVVSGAGGTDGGSSSFSSVFASRTPAGSVSSSFSGSTSGASANISVSSSTISISVGGHSMSANEMPLHAHTYLTNQGTGGGQGGGGADTGSTNAITGGTGGSAAHTHGITQTAHSHGITQSNHSHGLSGSVSSSFSGNAMDFAVQYIDVIICTRD